MNGILFDRLRLSRKLAQLKPTLPSSTGMRLLELPQATVRLREVGHGRHAVVFCPDPPNVIEHYDALFALLKDEVRVVCFEAPGFGLSLPRLGFDFSLDSQADLVVDLLAALNVETCTLGFPCASAYVALEVARRLPAKVTGLALIQAPSWGEEQAWLSRIDRRGLLLAPGVGQVLSLAGKRPIIRRWYRAALGDPFNAPVFVVNAFDALNRGGSFSLGSGLQALRREKDRRFAPVPQKAAVVWGMKDRTHRKSDPASMLACLPNGRVELFESSGHFPELEEPERFCDVLRSLRPSN